MLIDADIYDFENTEVIECLVTRIENSELTDDMLEQIKDALDIPEPMSKEEMFAELFEGGSLEDIIHGMDRGQFDIIFDLMKNSWQGQF